MRMFMRMLSRLATTVTAGLLCIPSPATAQTGAIAGTVTLDGSPPAPRMLEVTKNQEVCGDRVAATYVVVNDGKLAYAVAFVEGLDGEAEPKEYMLSNADCSFSPPVLAAAAGGTLVVDNRDDVLHNTHLNFERGNSSRTVGNWALSRKGTTIRADRPLRRAGIIDVECDAHPWMHAKILVLDHPYFATSAENGAFILTGIPPGDHTLKVWHEVYGELAQGVTVRANETATVSFTFSRVAGP